MITSSKKSRSLNVRSCPAFCLLAQARTYTRTHRCARGQTSTHLHTDPQRRTREREQAAPAIKRRCSICHWSFTFSSNLFFLVFFVSCQNGVSFRMSSQLLNVLLMILEARRDLFFSVVLCRRLYISKFPFKLFNDIRRV